MFHVRAPLLKAIAALGVVAGLAACDAAPSTLAPHARAIAAPPLRAATDTARTPMVAPSVDDPSCRSGYQIAYRDDGSWYCEPVPGI